LSGFPLLLFHESEIMSFGAFNQIRFSCESLVGTNRVGLLKQTDNGYYPMVVGALNVYNSGGSYYVYEQAKHLFEESSALMRRVKRGVLKGEYGHPVKQPGMTQEDFMYRAMDILPTNVCCHHRSIRLDFDSVKDENGKPLIAIISEVQPSGPMGDYLKASLDNKDENVCFSIRAFSDDKMLGKQNVKTLRNVITFDYVIEPGIAYAEKYKSPTLESRNEMVVSKGLIERALAPKADRVATESIKLTAQELFQSFGWSHGGSDRPIWSQW
jgi:hypothetical protein